MIGIILIITDDDIDNNNRYKVYNMRVKIG